MSADKLFAAMYIMKNNSEEEAGVIRRRKRLNFAGQSFFALQLIDTNVLFIYYMVKIMYKSNKTF